MMNQDVRLGDARQLFRMLRDASDFVDGEEAQRHILGGICRILGARVATSGLVTGLDRGAFELSRSQCVGVNQTEMMTLFSPYMSHGTKGDPLLSRHLALPQEPAVRVSRRRDLVSDAEWSRDAIVNDVRAPLHLDDTIHGHRVCGSGAVVGLQIVRDTSDGSFDERDRNLVELLICEAGPHLAPAAQPEAAHALTLRERQTLERLLSGDSEKQAAARLGVSPHTLHDYVKRIYRAFNVASRGELMARLRRPDPSDAQRLTPSGAPPSPMRSTMI